MFGGKDYIAVLNFLATKIEISIAEKTVNNNVVIIATSVSDYAGFFDGEFLEPQDLAEAISECVNNAQSLLGKKLDNLYIGVPAEFCNYALKNLKANYVNKVVIKKKHLEDLFASVCDDEVSEDYTVISKSPIYYVLDDGVQTTDPLDSFTKNLGAKASLILAKNDFISLVLDALSSFKIKDVAFVPIPLAIGMNLLDLSVRQTGAIFVDFDYVSTSVVSVVGEGIIDMKYFGVGDGHILADLAEVLKLNYFTVEKLKKEIILTLDTNSLDNYEIETDDGETVRVSARVANEVVKARLDSIAEILNKILFSFQYKQDRTMPIYLTGSGIVYINGARNYLSKALNRKCEILSPSKLEYADPKYSEKIALMNFVFDTYR